MKIALLVNHYPPSVGGCQIIAEAVAVHLAKSHDVYVFTRKVKGRSTADMKGVKVVEYVVPQNASVFLKNLDSIKPDVVFIYSDVFDFFRAIITRQNKFRLVIAPVGSNWVFSHRNFPNMFYRAAPQIHKIICHGICERDYRICSVGTLAKKTVIIPNAVDLSEFDNNTLTRQDLCEQIADKRWVLNVSNFFPGKGQDHLIRILTHLPNPKDVVYVQVSNDIDFTIGETLENAWKNKVKVLQDRGMSVKLMKNQPRERVIGFFKNSNVFAFTSEKEVAPVVLLESMASTTPWVATDVGNAPSLSGGRMIPALKNSRFHSVFDERIDKFFVKSIQEVWDAPIGTGRLQIEKEMTWDVVLPQYEKAILE